MMIYLLKICIFQAAFALVYVVLLKNLSFFKINRWFLIFGAVGSFLLPVLTIDSAGVVVESTTIPELLSASEELTTEVWRITNFQPNGSEDGLIPPLLYSLYGTVIAFLLLRFIVNLFRTFNTKNNYELIESVNGVRIYSISSSLPYSFFNRVYIPKMLSITDYEKVLAHELQHVCQKHSYDRLLIDFIITLLWINPFIHLIKKWLIETHEFEADALAIQELGEKNNYQMSLLNLSYAPARSHLVSFFNLSTLKRRIKMINQKKNTTAAKLRFLAIIPAISVLVLIFSFRPRVGSMLEFNIGPINEIFRLCELESQENIPSIFPVQVAEGTTVRVSSGFGMRTHPIDKEKRMHQGMDIAAAKGTPVIAAADGEIEKTDYQPNGYGNYVIIRHDATYQTKYAQLESFTVKAGEPIKKGEILGYVGSSGKSTAPHLHYEVRKNGKVEDPSGYINNYQVN